jgi:hypothetical protein
MKVKITLTEEMLGTACANPDVHREFIASKSADADKVEAEMATLPAAELVEKSTTVFHRGPDGGPILYDYQVKGFIKEQVRIMLALTTGCKVGTATLSKWTADKMVDNHVHVGPRMIPLAVSGAVGLCTRPLRAQTMKGERVSLASSETVPAGTTFEFTVDTDHAALGEFVERALDRGAIKGLGQWRNSGKGRFTWAVAE